MNLIKKIGTGIATGALMAGLLTPAAFAATTITVSGNGAGSVNTVNSTSSNNTSVSQTNIASVSNVVVANSNTGNNTASFNTGGSTLVRSGNSSTTTTITNRSGLNVLSLRNCKIR